MAYAAIPAIKTLPQPLRDEVRDAFARSISIIWQVMAGISGIGLLACPFMRALPLTGQVDEKWGLEGDKPSVETQEK